MFNKHFSFYILISLLAQFGLLWNVTVKADLIFSAPPRESPEIGKKLFGPLAEHFTKLLGQTVTYEYPQNWLQYQRDLRKNVYDIIFDGPHFVSWRLEHLEHEVLLKLPGTLQFIVIVNSDDIEIKTLQDLIGKKVCGIPPPNLATMSVIEQFPNPVRQPVIWGVSGGYMHVFKSFIARECRAAVFRTTFYEKKLSEQDRAGTRILYKSKPFPNQAISVSTRVSNKDKQKIILSLTEGTGVEVAKPIVRRFGGAKANNFVKSTNSEYANYNLLLEGIIFGW